VNKACDLQPPGGLISTIQTMITKDSYISYLHQENVSFFARSADQLQTCRYLLSFTHVGGIQWPAKRYFRSVPISLAAVRCRLSVRRRADSPRRVFRWQQISRYPADP
jgi:hypothetical protein